MVNNFLPHQLEYFSCFQWFRPNSFGMDPHKNKLFILIWYPINSSST